MVPSQAVCNSPAAIAPRLMMLVKPSLIASVKVTTLSMGLPSIAASDGFRASNGGNGAPSSPPVVNQGRIAAIHWATEPRRMSGRTFWVKRLNINMFISLGKSCPASCNSLARSSYWAADICDMD